MSKLWTIKYIPSKWNMSILFFDIPKISSSKSFSFQKQTKKITFGSWKFSIPLSIIFALIGFLVAGLNGAIVMFVVTYLLSFINLLNIVPFAGIFLYFWISNMVGDWLISIANISEFANIYTVKTVAILICGISGFLVYLLLTFFGVVLLLMMLGAIAGSIKNRI